MTSMLASGYAHKNAPAFHPLLFACCKQPAMVPISKNPPLGASPFVAGLPTTSFSSGIPTLEAISNSELPG